MMFKNYQKGLANLFVFFAVIFFISCAPQQVITPPVPISIPQLSRIMLPVGSSISDSSMEQQCPSMEVIRSLRGTEIVFPPSCYGKTIHISKGGILHSYLLSQNSEVLIPAQQPEELAKITLSSDATIIDWNKCPGIQVFVKGNGKEIHFPKSCFGKGVEIFTGSSIKFLDDLASKRVQENLVVKKRTARKTTAKKKKRTTRKTTAKKRKRATRKTTKKKKHTKVLPSNMMKVGSWQVEKKVRGKASYNGAASACRRAGMQLPPKSLLTSGRFSVSSFGEWSGASASTKEAWIVKGGRAKVTTKTNQLVYRCSRRAK